MGAPAESRSHAPSSIRLLFKLRRRVARRLRVAGRAALSLPQVLADGSFRRRFIHTKLLYDAGDDFTLANLLCAIAAQLTHRRLDSLHDARWFVQHAVERAQPGTSHGAARAGGAGHGVGVTHLQRPSR